MINCCKDCEDRTIECHGRCERYIEEKRKYDEKRKEMFKLKDNDRMLRSHEIGTVERMKKKKTRKGKHV